MRSLHSLLVALPFFISQGSASSLIRRENNNKCTDIHATSNNGDRKVAIVIDSSLSMLDSDPTNLRITAASNLIENWLIPKSKATSKKPADLVTVIEFSDAAILDYALGDPGAANASLANIGSYSGTLIASGVEMAIDQLTGSGSGVTAKRSGILVLTDGEDTDTPALVDQINKAAGLGIRVSFGFMSSSASYQDGDVLGAIMHSGGQYSTVFSATTANSFVNLVLVNGLTENDNPSGTQSQLLGGLSVSRFISGSDTVTVTYDARDNEIIDFTVESVDAGTLDIQAVLNGKVVDESSTLYSSGYLSVSTKDSGKVDIKVKANGAPQDSIITVGATSNLPTQNCTVGVQGGGSGLSKGGIAGLSIGLIGVFAGVGVGLFYLLKHVPYFKNLLKPKAKIPHGEPELVGDQPPHNLPTDAKIDPRVQTFPLNANPQPYYPPQTLMAAPPYAPSQQPSAPNDQHHMPRNDGPPQQNSTSDQPPNSTSDQPPQSSNPTGDQPPQNSNPTGDQPPQNNGPPQQPNQPQGPDDLDHDLSDFSLPSGSDTDDSHKKKRRRHKIRKDECSCLQCEHCFDCGPLCSPDCSKDPSATIGITGGRDCGVNCRVHCKHSDKYDCDAKRAHKKHRHRCHRCRAHNDEHGEGKDDVCGCRTCEVCTECTTDCGPGGCPPLGNELNAGRGHVHVRHRCIAHTK